MPSRHSRCNARFYNLFSDAVEACPVGLIVAIVDREVELVCAVDLDIEETGTVSRILRSITDTAASDTHLRMFPPRSTILAGRSFLRKKVFCESRMTPRRSSTQRSFSMSAPSSWGSKQFVKQIRPLEDVMVDWWGAKLVQQIVGLSYMLSAAGVSPRHWTRHPSAAAAGVCCSLAMASGSIWPL